MRKLPHFPRCILIVGAFLLLPLSAQEGSANDPFGREAAFINYLMEQGLFQYANMAMEEARQNFPESADRLEVLSVGTLLRQGKTEEVEELLAQKDLPNDPKAQAILLQLAMTYDALRKNDLAMTKYQQFLDLNEGKEITDPDLIRYFASAGMRLALILQERGDYSAAATVLDLVVATTEDEILKRKFQILVAQNRIDQGIAEPGAQADAFKKAEDVLKEIMFGANDQYLMMAVGLQAWIEHLQGNTEEAIASMAPMKSKSIRLEKMLQEAEIPASEFPRPPLRYVEGVIQFDQAKELHAAGDEAGSKAALKKSLGNLYNTFLKYEGNDYSDRAALLFEEVNDWTEETYGKRPTPKGGSSPRLQGLMFKRQLDLAKKLLNDSELEKAEDQLLGALNQYPETSFTLGAYDTLARIWMEEGDKKYELLALSEQIGERHADSDLGAQILLRIGRAKAEEENLEDLAVVLGAFGRNFPSHPSAPAMLFRIGESAMERGEAGMALAFYDDIVELYPQSNFAVRVLQVRGESALEAGNTEAALAAFEKVRDESRNPLQVFYARLRVVDTKLQSGDPKMEEDAVADLRTLRTDLEDRSNPIYESEDANRADEFLQNVRFRTGIVLLKKASLEKTDAARAAASSELQSYLQDYPNTDQSPEVMFNLGRLYLQQGAFEEASRTFDRLAQQYPDSEAGRDALYSLVKASLEENQVDVARDAVDKMVAQPEAYEIEKIYRAAQLMAEYEQWEQAKIAYELVQNSNRIQTNKSMKQRVLLGLGEAAIGAGDPQAAATALQALVDEFPKSTTVLQGGSLLAEAYLAINPPNTEKAREALSAVSRVLRSRPDKVGKAHLDIMLGKVAMAANEPGQAMGHWYGVGLTQADSPELAALVREAIQLSLDEAQRQIKEGNTARWNLVIELTDQFLNNFPLDTKADEMRVLNIRAISLATEE